MFHAQKYRSYQGSALIWNNLLSQAFTYFGFIGSNEIITNYVYNSANTQNISYINRISCTHAILEVIFTSTLKPNPTLPLDYDAAAAIHNIVKFWQEMFKQEPWCNG